MKITENMVREWLGTSNQLREAVDIIKEMANLDYSVESLQQDIKEYFSEHIIRLRSK